MIEKLLMRLSKETDKTERENILAQIDLWQQRIKDKGVMCELAQ